MTEVENPEPLDLQRLHEAWQQYGSMLEAQHKHASATTFKAAELMIVDEDSFLITVHATIQKRQIEQERIGLLEKLQSVFKNRMLSFQIELSQTSETQSEIKPAMSSRQRFELMAAKNPSLALLKDKLKLELDY